MSDDQQRIADLERALRLADEAVGAREGVSILYYAWVLDDSDMRFLKGVMRSVGITEPGDDA